MFNKTEKDLYEKEIKQLKKKNLDLMAKYESASKYEKEYEELVKSMKLLKKEYEGKLELVKKLTNEYTTFISQIKDSK